MNTSQSATRSPDPVSWPAAGRAIRKTEPPVTADLSRPARRPMTSNLNVHLNVDLHVREGAVKENPRKSVLRKIAARRQRTERPDARPAWATILLGNGSGGRKGARRAGGLGVRILTPREMEVLHLVARGDTDKHIADRLYLSRRTVNSHVSNILAKLDVPSRRAAVIAAARIGLL
jgi:DNA-binding CsgD family transcriptional regulator